MVTMSGLRIGVADHLGWAVVITSSCDHEVVDRRRVELIEPGLPQAPIHHVGGPHQFHRQGSPLDDQALAELVAEVRESAIRATSKAFDELTGALPGPVISMSLRSWPPDFPEDVSVQRRVPHESRADPIMYRKVLAELARRRSWEVQFYDAKSVCDAAVRVLGAPSNQALDSPRSKWGAPWSKDHRVAFAATIVAR